MSVLLRQVALRYWRRVGAVFGGSLLAAGTTAYLVIPREYRADVVLATVTSQRTPALGGLAALANLPTQGGLVATPEVVAALMRTNGVLSETAKTRVGPRSCVARLSGADAEPVVQSRIVQLMRARSDVQVDRRTGLMTATIVSADTAAARACLMRLVQISSDRFARTARVQAMTQARGLATRVDSAAAQLRQAEAALNTFVRHNRNITPYSVGLADYERLRRAAQLSEQVYLQAITERETAEARVLEDTPAVVVVDDIPTDLPRVSRGVAQKALVVAVVVTLLFFAVLTTRMAAREPFRSMFASWHS